MKRIWIFCGALVIALVAWLALAALGPSPIVKALTGLKAGDPLPEGNLLPNHFAERKWNVESWSVVSNGRCLVMGGVLVDRARPPESPFAHVAATAMACGGQLLPLADPDGPRIWITPSFGSEGPIEVKHELRFAEALGPRESVAWSTSSFTVRQKDVVRSLQVVEEAFRERDGRLDRALFVRSVNDVPKVHDERVISLDSYHCAFEGDAFPRSFRCTYRGQSTGATWDDGTGSWIDRGGR